MGAEGLEPSRPLRSTDFHPLAAFAAALGSRKTMLNPSGFEDWTLPLPSAVR